MTTYAEAPECGGCNLLVPYLATEPYWQLEDHPDSADYLYTPELTESPDPGQDFQIRHVGWDTDLLVFGWADARLSRGTVQRADPADAQNVAEEVHDKLLSWMTAAGVDGPLQCSVARGWWSHDAAYGHTIETGAGAGNVSSNPQIGHTDHYVVHASCYSDPSHAVSAWSMRMTWRYLTPDSPRRDPPPCAPRPNFGDPSQCGR